MAAGEGIPKYTSSYVSDLYGLEVAPWARTGQSGAFVNLAAQQFDDGQLHEIAPGGQTEVQHHMFEALIYVVEGLGATTFWQRGDPKQTVDWQRASLFSPPLNCYHQHFNLDGDRPARLYAATTATTMINLMNDLDFIFNSDHVFTGVQHPGRLLHGPGATRRQHAVGDKLRAGPARPSKWTPTMDAVQVARICISRCAGNSSHAHISEFQPGTYKKAHRHGAGAHVIILGGQGYSLLFFEDEEPRKADWRDGSVVSSQHAEFHQHFNTGPEPARDTWRSPSAGQWSFPTMAVLDRVRARGSENLRPVRAGVHQARGHGDAPTPPVRDRRCGGLSCR